MGFEIEDDLNTDLSRQKWLQWRRRIDPGHWLDPAKRARAGEEASRAMVAEDVRNGLVSPESAREHYAVVLTADGGVDEAATRAARGG